MKKTIISMLLLIVSSSVFAEWTLVASAAAKDGSSVGYADLSTIRRSGTKAKMWSLRDYKIIQTAGSVSLLSSERQDEYDCTEDQSRFLAFNLYSGHMGGGSVVDTNSIASEWIPVPPGSVIYYLWKVACEVR